MDARSAIPSSATCIWLTSTCRPRSKAEFWDMMRSRPGSRRAPLTPQQRAKKPPVAQPIFRTHPITGRTILYCNPGYAVRIDGMEEAESQDLLAFLFAHQEQKRFLHAHRWSQGDVLMWDNIGTVHHAVADYGPDEPRYMRRVQVMLRQPGSVSQRSFPNSGSWV